MKDKREESHERLTHMWDAILEIESFTHDVTSDDFVSNPLLVSAVLFQFSVIGEAVVHVEPALLEKYDYPWYQVRAFRNLISHEYFQIKMEAVWDIVAKNLPGLKNVIGEVLEKEF